MKQPRAKLAQTIADTTLKHGVKKSFSKEIAAYLLSEHRVSELDSVLRDVQADWATAGRIEVIARSAHPLTAATKASIIRRVKQRYPTASDIIVNEVFDQEIIGGVRLNLPDQQLDLSVEAKLNKFKQLTTAGKD